MKIRLVLLATLALIGCETDTSKDKFKQGEKIFINKSQGTIVRTYPFSSDAGKMYDVVYFDKEGRRYQEVVYEWELEKLPKKAEKE